MALLDSNPGVVSGDPLDGLLYTLASVLAIHQRVAIAGVGHARDHPPSCIELLFAEGAKGRSLDESRVVIMVLFNRT